MDHKEILRELNTNPKDRTETINMRVTPAQKERLKRLAIGAGMTLTAYMLGMALGDAIGQTIINGYEANEE